MEHCLLPLCVILNLYDFLRNNDNVHLCKVIYESKAMHMELYIYLI